MKSIYELLGASEDNDADALKKAFRNAVKAHHPDLHPNDPDAAERFRQIIAANAHLRDLKNRSAQDLLALERQQFQLTLKRSQLARRRLRLKRICATVAVFAIGALVGGYGLFAHLPMTTILEINWDKHAATTGAAIQEDRQTATAVTAAKENDNTRAAIAVAEADAVKGDNAGEPVETALRMAPANPPEQGETRRKLDSAEVANRVVKPGVTASEPARLSVSAADVGADAAVVIGGLAPGSTLSVGTRAGPTTWRLSTQELGEAAITPPRGFVGAMELTLELRLVDNTLADRKSLRLEWLPKSAVAPPVRQLAASDIEVMVKSGAEYMANGNVEAARMMLRPAAEAGDPAAAFALAETYDPLALRKLNAKGGITADVGLAQTWYEKAKDLGSAVAPERLKRLARLPE